MRETVIGWLALLVLTSVAEAQPVVVASKNFPENHLLGEIMAQLIERETDIPVVRKLDLGYSTVVYQSLRSGAIDIYPEYTGTAWEEYLKITRRVSDPLEAYLVVRERMRDEMGLLWLRPFGFENSFAMAMSRQRAEQLGIKTISQLEKHRSSIKVGVSPDFFERKDGFRNLNALYGLNIPRSQITTIEHGLAYQQVDEGTVDVIDVWTTDGKLVRFDLAILDDDQGFFPPYHCAPVIRVETLEQHPELEDVLGQLAFRIDQRKMQVMNSTLEERRDDPTPYKTVARMFLDGSFDENEDGHVLATEADHFNTWTFIRGRLRPTGHLAVQHLMLTGISVGLAILIGVPLGLWLTRQPAAVPVILGGAGIIQTIPSLALLAVMIPLLGLGFNSAVVALTLYALLPIIRNTYTGIMEVDGQLIEAARGIGLTDGQILWRVELPLAVRTIMAGVRTAAVITIGVAALAALIGAGGLGEPIITGLQLNDTGWILSGAIAAATLALLVDFGLGRLERLVSPRGLS